VTVPVHTFQFYGARVTGAGRTTLYTVPAGYRALVKAILVHNAASVTKSIELDVDSAFSIYQASLTAVGTSGATGQLNGFIPLNAAQVISYVGSAGCIFDIVIGGYLYPLTI
jgi:hypothetical protein